MSYDNKGKGGEPVPAWGYHTIIIQGRREDSTTARGPGNEEEEALVHRAKAMDQGAWTSIYEINFPLIFRYVRARVYDDAAASDIAASVFVAAVTGVRTYKYRGRPFLAWLYRIAHNLVGDYRRKTLRERQRALQHGPSLTHYTNGRGAADPAAMIEDLDLRAALERLPDSQRDVLILRFFVGLSTQEIADVLGKQAAAVYSLQARAVASLRNALQ